MVVNTKDRLVPVAKTDRLGERVRTRDTDAVAQPDRDKEGAAVPVVACVAFKALLGVAVPDLEGVAEGVGVGVERGVPDLVGEVVPDLVTVREGVGVEDRVAPMEGVAEQEAWLPSPVYEQHPLVHRVGATEARGQKWPTGQVIAELVALGQ